jgi:hypothetical protein
MEPYDMMPHPSSGEFCACFLSERDFDERLAFPTSVSRNARALRSTEYLDDLPTPLAA